MKKSLSVEECIAEFKSDGDMWLARDGSISTLGDGGSDVSSCSGEAGVIDCWGGCIEESKKWWLQESHPKGRRSSMGSSGT